MFKLYKVKIDIGELSRKNSTTSVRSKFGIQSIYKNMNSNYQSCDNKMTLLMTNDYNNDFQNFSYLWLFCFYKFIRIFSCEKTKLSIDCTFSNSFKRYIIFGSSNLSSLLNNLVDMTVEIITVYKKLHQNYRS